MGGYASSDALEWAGEAGDVCDEESLAAWLSDLLILGFARSDAILLSRAFSAAEAGDAQRLAEVNALVVALAPSAELRLETCQQLRSFLDSVAASWPNLALESLAPAFAGEVAHPVAVGTAAAVHGLPKGGARLPPGADAGAGLRRAASGPMSSPPSATAWAWTWWRASWKRRAG